MIAQEWAKMHKKDIAPEKTDGLNPNCELEYLLHKDQVFIKDDP